MKMNSIMDLDTIKSEDSLVGDEIRACRGCLATGVILDNIHEKGLGQLVAEFTGFPVIPTDGYPQLICRLCQFMLRKFFLFRMRCHSAMCALQQMEINNVKISTESLKTIDRTHIKHNLQRTAVENVDLLYMDLGDSLNKDKSIEQCMVNEITETDVMEDDDKPLKHFVTATVFEDDMFRAVKDDEGSDDDFVADHDEGSEDDDGRTRVRKRNSDIKLKKLKTESVKTKSHSKKTNNMKKTKIKREIESHKKKNNEMVRKKVKREISQDGDYELLKTIANILRKIWQVNRNSNIAEIWELVYKQSLSVKDENVDELDCITLKKNASTKQQIVRFVELTKKLSKLYNMEVQFLSVEDHRREIEDRRRSDKFANAPYKCEFCCKVYIFEDTYKRHMVSHDLSSGDVECEICRYRFKNRKRYMNHFHIYHTKKIICKECGVVNRTWNVAKQHYKWHGGVTTVCEQCGKHFSDKKLYCMHVRAVHRAELATTLCLLCGDTYNGDTGLRMHMDKTHRQAERCLTCGSVFRCMEARLAHEEAGCEPGCSSCPTCGANFPSEEMMRQHFDEQHKKEFNCEACNKSLATLMLYKKHVKKCLLPKGRYKGKRDGTKEKGEKQTYNLNLMCELCGKGNFKCFSTLRSHQRVHTGERPYRCDICQKTFRELQFLKNHMKTHTDERRYKCPFCPKAFRQMGHRAAHILTHTKERPYACTSCTKRYTGLTALKEHINTAHRGLPPRQRQKNKDKQEL